MFSKYKEVLYPNGYPKYEGFFADGKLNGRGKSYMKMTIYSTMDTG